MYFMLTPSEICRLALEWRKANGQMCSQERIHSADKHMGIMVMNEVNKIKRFDQGNGIGSDIIRSHENLQISTII